MSDLTERVRAAIEAAAGAQQEEYGFTPVVRDEMAAAAIREVLAALPRPLADILCEVNEDDFRTALGFIARENRIEP